MYTQDKIVRSTAVDEDYGTDDGILANTKRICKRDLLEVFNDLGRDSKQVERNTHNYRYQVRFGAAATGTVVKNGRKRSVRSMKIAQRKDSMDQK